MTTPAFTVILPHKRNPGNDAALRICIDMLMANTRADFILMMDAAADEYFECVEYLRRKPDEFR